MATSLNLEREVTNIAASVSLTSLDSSLKQNDTKVSSGGTVRSYSHDTGSGPVLCMVHGYPESAFMWRHVVPLLKDKVSMFIPELPGYGLSSLPPKSDKRTVGNLIMEALQSTFGKDRPVIWCGHDRGGRVGHRLIVDNKPEHNIQSAMLLDIVPTLEQWRVFSNPVAAVAYYHWPFLATPTAPELIEKMGGYNYCQNSLTRAKGGNASGVAKFRENDAVDHYCALFSKPETISGSCADYAAGAKEDVEEQEKDQKEGRKISVPTMAVYSASNLGRMHDVDAVWPKWASGEKELKCVGIPDGYGHYLPEECPEKVAELIVEWLGKYGARTTTYQFHDNNLIQRKEPMDTTMNNSNNMANTAASCGLLTLPAELLVGILCQVSVLDVIHLSATCRHLTKITDETSNSEQLFRATTDRTLHRLASTASRIIIYEPNVDFLRALEDFLNHRGLDLHHTAAILNLSHFARHWYTQRCREDGLKAEREEGHISDFREFMSRNLNWHIEHVRKSAEPSALSEGPYEPWPEYDWHFGPRAIGFGDQEIEQLFKGFVDPEMFASAKVYPVDERGQLGVDRTKTLLPAWLVTRLHVPNFLALGLGSLSLQGREILMRRAEQVRWERCTVERLSEVLGVGLPCLKGENFAYAVRTESVYVMFREMLGGAEADWKQKAMILEQLYIF